MKIVAVGRNYVAHAKELGNAVPTQPVLFLKPPSSLLHVGMGSILLPAGAEVHHEVSLPPPTWARLTGLQVELAVEIGRGGRRIAAADALQHVRGYRVALDMTARNWQDAAKKAGLPWDRAKGPDTFCPVGPLVPRGSWVGGWRKCCTEPHRTGRPAAAARAPVLPGGRRTAPARLHGQHDLGRPRAHR